MASEIHCPCFGWVREYGVGLPGEVHHRNCKLWSREHKGAEVHTTKTELIVLGEPDENDESHNCDAMGCGTFSHVLFRFPLPAGAALSQAHSDGERALDLLDTLFTAYEDGFDVYEDPEECAGHMGHAVKLDDETFHACADLLNRTRPSGVALPAEAQPTGQQYNVANRLLDMLMREAHGTSTWPENWMAVREQLLGAIRAAGVKAWPPAGTWEHACSHSTAETTLLRAGEKCSLCGAVDPFGVLASPTDQQEN